MEDDTEKLDGAELDAALARELGVEPHIVHIVTKDGGKSACASTSIDGPWHARRDLENWLALQQLNGFHTDYVIGQWERWPRYSRDIAKAFEAVEAAVNMIPETVQVLVRVLYPGSGDTAVTTVSICGLMDDATDVAADADDLPTALARCALRAARATKAVKP